MSTLVTLLIVALFISLTGCAFFVRRAYQLVDQIQTLEEELEIQHSFIVTLKAHFTRASTVIRNVDRTGAFEADDEVGTAFKIIDEEIERLDTYINNINFIS